MADLLQFWTDLSGPRLFGGIFRYPSALAEQLMADINPSINISQRVTWECIVNNTYSWLNIQALFNQAQQAEFKRQQKCHATLNNLEKATEQLYNRSLQAKAQDNARKVKAEADNVQLPSKCQLAHKKRQEQAKVTGIVTSSTDGIKYPYWHPQSCHKTPGLDIPQVLPDITPDSTKNWAWTRCTTCWHQKMHHPHQNQRHHLPG